MMWKPKKADPFARKCEKHPPWRPPWSGIWIIPGRTKNGWAAKEEKSIGPTLLGVWSAFGFLDVSWKGKKDRSVMLNWRRNWPNMSKKWTLPTWSSCLSWSTLRSILGLSAYWVFCPTSRFGKPEDFMLLVDELHKNNIEGYPRLGAFHFPEDAHGLGFSTDRICTNIQTAARVIIQIGKVWYSTSGRNRFALSYQ